MNKGFFPLAVSAVLLTMSGIAGAQDGPSAPPESEADKALLLNVDKLPGFSGMAFGDAFPTSGDKFEIEQDRGNLKIYKGKDAKLLFGPALLDTLLYYVWDGKLYGVALHTDDGQDSLALKSILVNAFGTGQASSDGAPSTIWIGKKNGVLFDLNTASGEGVAFLFNNALHDEQLKQQSQESKDAAAKLIKGE